MRCSNGIYDTDELGRQIPKYSKSYPCALRTSFSRSRLLDWVYTRVVSRLS